MIDANGYVLTGGASSRMGRDKCSLPFGGTTLGEHAAAVLRQAAKSVFAVGRPIDGTPLIEDVFPGKAEAAAMYGLHAALAHSPREWTAVLACDLPFITPDLFRLLFTIARSAGKDAVVPVQPDGRSQPLAAVYRTEPALAAVEKMLASSNKRLQHLRTEIETRLVQPTEYSSLTGSDRFFSNLNSPDDYESAVRARKV